MGYYLTHMKMYSPFPNILVRINPLMENDLSRTSHFEGYQMNSFDRLRANKLGNRVIDQVHAKALVTALQTRTVK